MKERLVEKGYLNKEMLIGIRPEDLQLVDDEKKELSITAEVEISELMGAETLVYIKLNGENVISKINSMDTFDAGQKVQLGINFDQIHFFDKETELRVPILDEVQLNQSIEKERFNSMSLELFKQDFKIYQSATKHI